MTVCLGRKKMQIPIAKVATPKLTAVCLAFDEEYLQFCANRRYTPTVRKIPEIIIKLIRQGQSLVPY
jgi:hypothetical protein